MTVPDTPPGYVSPAPRVRRAAGGGPSQTDLVLDLRQIGRGDLALAGGKGANLGELLRAGFPVPPGFVVTTAAYDRFVAHAQLDAVIGELLRQEPGDGSAIRAAFEAAPIPPDVQSEVLASYERLGRGPVAVRSSATAEDLPRAAFAGQQDTFLNVVGPEALLEAVRRCWASLWTERAIAYRARQGIDQATLKLAVVVQRMVAAEVAGVLFTANPLSGARDEIVIDASPGLGEAVVSGLVTPDHYVLRTGRWRILERRLGRREVLVRPRAGGGTEHVVPAPTAAPAPVLPNRTLRDLARTGAAIQRHFGTPQDVEWAWADGRIFILQARPITALPEPMPRSSRPVRMLAALVAEMLPARPYPLEASTWGVGLLLSAVLGPMFRLLGLELHLSRLFVEEDGIVVRLNPHLTIRPTPEILLALPRLLRLARRYDPTRWRADPLLVEVQARVRELEARELSALSWAGLLDTVRACLIIPFIIGKVRLRYFPRAALALGCLRLVLALLGRGDRFGTLAFAGVETGVLAANRMLEALAARIRSDPTLASTFATHDADELWGALEAQRAGSAGQALLSDLRTFLDEYGHREAGGTLLVSQGTWRTSPAVVLGILQGLARAEPRPQSGPPAWEVVRDELLTRPLLRLPPARSAFLALVTGARHVHQLREDTRFYAMLPLPVLHRTLLELGRRLANTSLLDLPGDVFHLRLVELERLEGAWPPPAPLAGELRALVARRRAKRTALEGTPLVDPRLLLPTARDGEATPPGEVLLRGIPGSPGLAEGPVRLIRNSSEFGTLRAGEVLVAPFTNPAWTPLFQRAAAVVVDSGAAASHAAIVAREYAIPAVMATGDGTRRLTDGQRVRVDGGRGLVYGVPTPTPSPDVLEQPS